MKYLLNNVHTELLTNQNYIPLSFDYSKSAILQMLEHIPKTELVTSCDRNTIAKISMLLGNKLPIHTILYFCMNPTVHSIIHIDKNLENTALFQASFGFNLPLANSEDVLMRWYSKNISDTTIETFVGPNGGNTPSITKDRVTCINKVYYANPLIVKINDWHSVENQSATDVAQFISLRFVATIEQVIKAFGEK
jgi:hypothetical protein